MLWLRSLLKQPRRVFSTGTPSRIEAHLHCDRRHRTFPRLELLKLNQDPKRLLISKMSSNTSVTGKCEHISTDEVARGKWIALNNITYKDPTGQERKWEAISRTTKNSGEADAIGVIAVFKDPSQECECVVLVRQYRPPLKAYTIEFPAGLIDAGETAAEAAVREMKEETGYEITVQTVLPASALDGGVGETTMKIVLCKLDADSEKNKNPKAVGGGSDEFVQVLVEPVSSLLDKLNEFSDSGDVVDSRVYSWAVGKLTV